MITIVLRDADEVCVRGVGWIGNQRIVETVWRKRDQRAPHVLIQPAQHLHALTPALRRRCRRWRPVVLRREGRGIAAEAAQDDTIRAGKVKHQLPDGVGSRERMRSGLVGGDARERLEDRGTVPCLAVEGTTQLIFETFDFPCHRAHPLRSITARSPVSMRLTQSLNAHTFADSAGYSTTPARPLSTRW